MKWSTKNNMNYTKLKTQMDFYYELTQSSIFVFEIGFPQKILYSCGFKSQYLIDFFELQEIIDDVASKIDFVTHYNFDTPDFLTFYTKNQFIYNIFFVKTSTNCYYCFVSGPNILGFPTLDQVNLFSKNTQVKLHVRQQLLRDLYHIPKLSEKKLQTIGRLFYMLFNPTFQLPNEIHQITLSKNPLHKNVTKKKNTTDIYPYESTFLFDFLMKL